MTADERYKEHLAKIKPLLDELFARLETVQVSGKSALAKAVRYASSFVIMISANSVADIGNCENSSSLRIT